jgi:oligosaccharide repeat unit polymerase
MLGLFAAELFLFFSQPAFDDYWLSLAGLTVLLCIPGIVACVTRRLDPLEPVFIVSAAYFLYLVYAPGSNLLAGEQYFFGKLITPLVPRGSWYASLGIVGLWIGYYLSKLGVSASRVLPRPPSSRDGASTHAVIIAALTLLLFGIYLRASSLSWLQLISLGQVQQTEDWAVGAVRNQGAFRNYLYSTIDWLTVAYMLFLAFSRSGRRWLLPCFVCLLLIYTTIGFRYRILILAMAPAVYFCLKHRRRPGIAAMAVGTLICIAAIGIIGDLRNSFRSGAQVQLSDVSARSAGTSFAASLDIYQPYLAIIDGFPDRHEFLWGSSFAYLLVHPIPRSLWPEKPEAPIVGITRLTLGDAAVQSGVAYPNIGEFYANFGVAGIVIGMWLFGIVMRCSYEYMKRYSDNDWARVAYAITLPFLVQVVSRGYFVQIAQEAAFLFAPLAASMWVTKRHGGSLRRRRAEGVSTDPAVPSLRAR